MNILKEARLKNGFSLAEMAKRFETSAVNWHRWESGKHTPPQDIVEVCCLYLNIPAPEPPRTPEEVKRLIIGLIRAYDAAPPYYRQDPLHAHLKISRQTLHRWVNGQNLPTRAAQEKISQLIKYLLDRQLNN